MSDTVVIRSRNPDTGEFIIGISSSTDLYQTYFPERKLALCQPYKTNEVFEMPKFKFDLTLMEAKAFCGDQKLFYPKRISDIPHYLAPKACQFPSDLVDQYSSSFFPCKIWTGIRVYYIIEKILYCSVLYINPSKSKQIQQKPFLFRRRYFYS